MKLKKIWDNSAAFKQLLQHISNKEKSNLRIKGLQGSANSFLISSLINKSKAITPLLILTENKESALHFFQDIIGFSNLKENKNIYIFPSFEVLPYEDIKPDKHIIEQRMKVLSMLALSQNNNPRDACNHFNPLVIVSDYKAVFSRMVSVKEFKKQYKKLEVQGQLNPEEFLTCIVNQGYQVADIIEYPGQFSHRGGIIDIFPYSEEKPIRIELYGEQIETIRLFDLESQRSVKKINEIFILPQSEIGDFVNNKTDQVASFFDYLPRDTKIIIQELEEFKKTAIEYEKECRDIYQRKMQAGIQNILTPDYYFLNWAQLKDLIQQKKSTIILESRYLYESRKKNGFPASSEDYEINSSLARNYYGKLDLFFEDLKQWQKEKKNILVLTSNNGRAKRMAEIFSDRNIHNFQIIPLVEAEISPDNICLSYGQVNYGFSIPSLQLIVVTDKEIFGRERDRSYRTSKYQGKPFHQLDELKPGDYVVHIEHGIGQYAGIYSKKREGISQDYILVKYAEDDELYVPVDKLNLIHKYIGVGEHAPRLYRLGGSSWKRVKKKVRESIQKIARELFELYKNRKSINGFSFTTDSVWQQELEMAFPFEETPDQHKALLDVKRDMESANPMERLICGDVGYGKTEIAIRAAFKAVMDGKQVAILAPTTILAQQHWENFSERIKPFPVRIEMLSRFKSKKEQQNIIADLEQGKVDIVIGTHRLVQKDIIFKDLGLLIVDEEQRFGVIHKERVKKIKEQVDSLTLTATPIPRTLYFSLIGVREMSLINTPPELRLPIVTYLREKTDNIIEEAVRREIKRGGQVYYVYNRVENIDYVASQLRAIIPEARIVIAHGQMPEEQLEKIMIDFMNKKYDILVCTTIIEIGLDIPNVNTIIIDDAHKFGLSQLYQLRGRVGRADRRAFAYLLYPSKGILTDNAKKRLEAIREFSDLGSGFRLAMRDLEIRGAGNLLGKEQHGFVSEVGFNFYCQLLEDSIDELKQLDSGKEKTEEKETEIIVKLESHIPEQYIPNTENRVAYYQRLSQIKSIKELHDFSASLQDIYGPYPKEVKNLIDIINLKLKLKKLGVTQAKITPAYFSLRYKSDSPVHKKIKEINAINNPSIKHYKRGSNIELKLLSDTGNESTQNNILFKANQFLEKMITGSN